MAHSFDSQRAPRVASFLWVNLTQDAHTTLAASLSEEYDVCAVRKPAQITSAIENHAPLFLCFEFDEPHASGMAALAQIRCAHARLPILMITRGQRRGGSTVGFANSGLGLVGEARIKRGASAARQYAH